jgi:hypothetical protein
MDLRRAGHQQAAVVVVAADLGALLVPRHHPRLGGHVAPGEGELLGQRPVVPRRLGAGEAARDPVMALDLLALDQLGGVAHGRQPFLVHGDRGGGADAAHQVAEGDRHGAADEARVAGGRALAGAFRLEHQDFASGARQGQRRRQPRQARADHRHVDLFGQRGIDARRPRCRLPPIGIAAEIGRQNRIGHRRHLRRRCYAMAIASTQISAPARPRAGTTMPVEAGPGRRK